MTFKTDPCTAVVFACIVLEIHRDIMNQFKTYFHAFLYCFWYFTPSESVGWYGVYY